MIDLEIWIERNINRSLGLNIRPISKVFAETFSRDLTSLKEGEVLELNLTLRTNRDKDRDKYFHYVTFTHAAGDSIIANDETINIELNKDSTLKIASAIRNVDVHREICVSVEADRPYYNIWVWWPLD